MCGCNLRLFSTLALCLLMALGVFSRQQQQYAEQKCVKMTNEICRDLGYNSTLMPNIKAGIEKIDEASRRISEFSPLFHVSCFVNFKFFICNMFLPVCHLINGNPTPVYPCRHVCEAAKKGCEPLMKRYNFQWPEVLDCTTLPSADERNALCGSPPEVKPSMRTSTEISISTKNPEWIDVVEQFPSGVEWNEEKISNLFGPKQLSVQSICQRIPTMVYVNRDEKEYCVSRCDAVAMFTKADKRFANVWISTWSVICFMSTLVTVCTFLIDHKRFKYPERPIIFLSFCYNLYSIGYLIRVFGSYDNIVCENSDQGKHIVIKGMSVRACSIVFFFLYFFGMASALWWVILSVTWFLSAALKWGHEAIEKYSSLFHAVSWTVPTIQTIIAFVTRKVDADVLSGLCYIGAANSEDLLLFVIVPLLIYLLVGTLFLVMGFVALVRIRKELQRERNTNKLERLIIRIGIFSVLYSVPATIVVACFIHEYNRLKERAVCLTSRKCEANVKPKIELFYLRYFMLLVVGVTSGVWIWTSKTFNSWRRFYRKHFNGQRKPEEEKEKLYKKSSARPSSSLSSTNQRYKPQRRVSNEAINQYNVGVNNGGGQVVSSNATHGSNPNMIQQTGYMHQPQPTTFFFPIQQHPAGFMQAHNMPVSQAARPLEVNSRGFAATPTSNMTSDYDQNSEYLWKPQQPSSNNRDMYHDKRDQFKQSRQIYSQTSSSDQQSLSRYPTNNGTLTRNGHMIDPPSSPKSLSSRSHYSTEAKL